MPHSPASLQLITLGRLALVDENSQDLISSESGKLLALLAYVASCPARSATREHLIDLFWADSEVAKARNALRQSLHKLREVLGEEILTGSGSGDVAIGPGLATDRDRFLEALAAGQSAEAIALYTGPFAVGLVSAATAGFERWASRERDRLRDLFGAAGETVARGALASGDTQLARRIAGRLLADNPLDETAWRIRWQAEQQAGSIVHLVASIAEFRRLIEAEQWQPEGRTVQLLQILERPLDANLADTPARWLVTDLIGRGPVLAKLYAAWREAQRGRGRHVHLTGGPGLGKTRLMDDFAVRLQAEQIRTAKARVLPRQRLVPGSMLASLVAALAELPGAIGVGEHAARMLIGIQPAISGRFPAATPLELGDPDARFRAQLDAIDDLIDAVSHAGRVCLLLDDVHWWDESSRRMIEHLLDRLDGRPVLVVTAGRPGAGQWSSSDSNSGDQLLPLTCEDVVAMLLSLGDHADTIAITRLADGLQRAASGVPLLILEAIRLGIDRNLLKVSDHQWCLDRLDEFLAGLHPGHLLNERLAILTDRQRELLLVAWLVELPLHGSDISAFDDTAGPGALLELERVGFLISNRESWVLTHDAIGEAVESGATTEQLRQAHCVAGVLIRRRGDSSAQLQQAAKQFLDAAAVDELLDTTTLWLRQRRAEHSVAPASELIVDLLGPGVDVTTVRALVARLPRSLRQQPWTARRLAPLWAVAGALVMAGGWWISAREPQPDAIVSILDSDGNGHVTESQIALRGSSWANPNLTLAATAVTTGAEWEAGFDSLGDEPVKDPARDRWALSREVAPSDTNYPTELRVHSDGSSRGLALAPGDDVHPSWSPDGAYVAFSTTRWSPRGDAVFNIGVVEVVTGAVRQVTAGRDSDISPVWSPDGTRIAFIRQSERAAPQLLCWVAVDGSMLRCHSILTGRLDGVFGLFGWVDGQHVLGTLSGGASGHVVSMKVDDGTFSVLDDANEPQVRISPDGVWLVEETPRRAGRETSVALTISQVANPAIRRSVLMHLHWPHAVVFWRQPPISRGLARLAILRPRDTITTHAPFHLSVEGSNSAGTTMPVPGAVITWSSSDSATATVDSAGDVHANRPGQVVITASAGGWRQVNVGLVVRQEVVRLLFEEGWDHEWPAAWLAWGTPSPRLVGRGNVAHALLPNGNGVYTSGLLSKQSFEAKGGLALDVELSTPITRTKWQFLQVEVRNRGALSRSGPTGPGCSIRYPASEGGIARTTIAGLRADATLWSGQWYRLRIQVFPDGSCGYAVNGLMLTHNESQVFVPDSIVIALSGQTVASDLLVGRVRVQSGVPEDVNWQVASEKVRARPLR